MSLEQLIAEELLLSTFTSKRQEVGKAEGTSAGARYSFYAKPNERLNTEASATSLPSNKTLTPQQ